MLGILGARVQVPAAVSGLGRFEILDKLGVGGMGAVYRALDRKRGVHVALKTLLETNGRSLYRFKREFRSLADVVHPNLVALYELHTVGDEWFFTMELVSGCSFIEYMRPYRATDDAELPQLDSTVTSTEGGLGGDETKSTGVWKPRPSGRQLIREGVLDLERLTASMFQLVDGVHALHKLDKLHRDLKPSNVLVDHDGRVVLLDFGLTSDRKVMAQDHTHEATAVGTPLYMSPEQAADVPLTNASDWYSVGIMLYEALTGRRPFEGRGRDIFLLKQTEDPPPPRDSNPEVPAWLDELCVAMIQRDPRDRPDAKHIFAALGEQPSAATIQLGSARVEQPFVGRTAELTTLRRAYRTSRKEAVTVFIRASSGMGKGALVHRFIEGILPKDDAIVLQGRCYERESVPYKALDAVVDALTRHLLDLPRDEVEALAPRDILALARLFPVIKRVDAINHPSVRAFEPVDPQETRRRGFSALCHVFRCLAKKRPVVLWIDGLQWGDMDSAAFLVNMFQHPDPVQILLIGTYRPEDERASPFLQALRQDVLPDKRSAVHVLDLTPLSPNEARELIDAVRPDQFDSEQVAAMLRDSQGSPLFLAELARRSADARSETGEHLTLDQLIAARIAKLSPDERAVLQVCAVAGHPIPPELCTRAAGVTGEARALAALQSERLVRLRQGVDSDQLVETYHDRIREAVLDGLASDHARGIHEHLARALEGRSSVDPAVLVDHWASAENMERASEAALRAAADAESILAFHRASEFYAFALDHQSQDADARRDILARYGRALIRAGRLDEAAEVFATAAEGASPAEQLEFGRLELEQLLRRGHLEAGLERSRAVLAAVGRTLPGSDLAAIGSIMINRLRLRIRGMAFKERALADIPPEDLLSVDVSWSMASAIAFVSPFKGRALQMSFMRDALKLGEPTRVAQAVCLEIGYQGVAGERSRSRCEALRKRGLALADRLEDPQLRGTLESGSGIGSFLCGRWAEADERLAAGEKLLRDHAANARWEIDISQIFRTSALVAQGRYAELTRLLPVLLREANDRGDTYAARGLQAWRGNIAWLVRDRPEEARDHVEAVSVGDSGAFHLHHYYELCSHTLIDLYEGNCSVARDRIEARWHHIKSAHLLRIQLTRIEAWHLRGRCALAAASQHATSPARRTLVKAAARAARVLDTEKAAWATPMAQLLYAGIAALGHDTTGARELLAEALTEFESVGMAGLAAACRYRLGELRRDDEGTQQVAAARAWMLSQCVVDVPAFVALLAPGFSKHAARHEDGPTTAMRRSAPRP